MEQAVAPLIKVRAVSQKMLRSFFVVLTPPAAPLGQSCGNAPNGLEAKSFFFFNGLKPHCSP